MYCARRALLHIIGGASLALAAGQPVLADDTELFIGASPGINPNILVIIDTSSSMNGNVTTQVPFNAATPWSGSCNPNRVYWRPNTGQAPDCSTNNWFDMTALRCQQAANAFAASGVYTDRATRWDAGATRWDELLDTDKTSLVECRGDSAMHGDGSNGTELWAANGAAGPWSANPADEVSWNDVDTGNQYTLYSGNYLNWFFAAPTTTMSRLGVVQSVATNLVNSISGVNIGLMRFSSGDPSEGGMVVHAMEDIATARPGVIAELAAMQGGGQTPLSEALYEAGQYLRGSQVVYGLNSLGNNQVALPSVSTSRQPLDQSLYQSPIGLDCQRNFIVLLTDGEPVNDDTANNLIQGLPNFGTLVGPACDGAGDGRCLDDMAAWMFEADLNAPLPGQQNVRTFTIGFTVDLPLLASTAARGGGQYFLADDTATLTAALTNIITQIQQQATTFSVPAAAVNAFNRTQNLNDLYVALFEPDERSHWPGNLKKFRIEGNQIVGVNGLDVVDPLSGFFRSDARSFWPDPVQPADGQAVDVGGAANQLPDPTNRRLFTNLGASDLWVPSNAVTVGNAAITGALLGGGSPGDPTRNEMIAFARGVDVSDSDLDGDTTETRRQMGDPLHANAQAVVYGGTAATPDVNDAAVLVTTNDGYLHAIDPMTGAELWAFVPLEVLDRTRDLLVNGPVPNKQYGIDGSMSVFRLDRNGNGIIETGDNDAVYLFFGMRRGGDSYYALDITDKDQPELMWQIDSSTAGFQAIGQSWSAPVVTRMDINSAPSQNAEKLVVVVSGGYDTSQDNEAYSTDALGAGLYFIDALSGNLLWRAGADAAADLQLAEMNNAIPATPRVLDMNSDGFADRLYVGDMGGRLWRFDIDNGQAPSTLVAGGVLARLGAGGIAGAPLADNRRFYNSPDVALVPTDTGGFLSVSVGSGYRAHPLNTNIVDGFFSVRDGNVFNPLTQIAYDNFAPAVIGDLLDVTAIASPVIPLASRGWRLTMNDANFVGEKVLSDPITFLGTTFFTTFTPVAGGNSCLPGAGTNRLFQVSVRDGAPVNNLDGIGGNLNLTVDDRTLLLPQGGIAPSPTFLFPDQSNCTGANCPDVIGLVGLVQFNPGAFPPYFRTYWTTQGAEQ